MNLSRVWAVSRKDIGEILVNSSVSVPMIIVPVLLCVIIPVVLTSLVLTLDVNMIQGAELIEKILPFYQIPERLTETNTRILYVFLNYSFIPLFLVVPLMVSSIIAANSVVGEKERKTLETLLYTPITNRELMVGKLGAAFIPAVAISLISFLLFAAAVNVTSIVIMDFALLRAPLWIAAILLMSPAVSLLGLVVTMIVSVKAKSFMAAQQISGVLVIPFVLLIVVQMTGLIAFNTLAVVVAAAAVLAIALVLLFRVAPRFTRERIISTL
ncbi:MAG: ABC transporter permease subunit [Spirochaetes bacterium]|nr:ABC transporter permease subunit [Spirochaetota bacterium]